jgi:hypothetical protein
MPLALLQMLSLLLLAALLGGHPASAVADSSGLHRALAGAGLEHTVATASALRRLGLSSLSDIELLDH